MNGFISDPAIALVALIIAVSSTIVSLWFLGAALRAADFRSRAVTFYAPVIGLALVLLTALALDVSSQTYLCQTCHSQSMNTPHAEVTCYGCHRDAGVIGFIIEKVSEPRMYLATALGRPSREEACVKNDACLRCHDEVLQQPVRTEKIIVSHREFVDMFPCAHCHMKTIHSRESLQLDAGMESCTACHEVTPEDNGCEQCHVSTPPRSLKANSMSWGFSHPRTWRSVHGKKQLGVCAACHDRNTCQECHTQMPHEPTWRLGHGTPARQDVTACATCHLPIWCDDCHGTKMPHPTGWRRIHVSRYEQTGDAFCGRCHTAGSCGTCHRLAGVVINPDTTATPEREPADGGQADD